jgi:hypothetical protein
MEDELTTDELETLVGLLDKLMREDFGSLAMPYYRAGDWSRRNLKALADDVVTLLTTEIDKPPRRSPE